MSTFPPIAEYGFLSDCENTCLVAPDGSVEWLCLPRPDSPSVFGALLDRSAGAFRFAPTNTQVPHQRRYLPGTMVLETTWHTPTGWLVVHDFLVVQPTGEDARRPEYRRAAGDESPTGTLLRTATCIAGRVEVAVDCVPLFDYGTTPGDWSYVGDADHQVSVAARQGDGGLTLSSSLRIGMVGARCYGRTTLEAGRRPLSLSRGTTRRHRAMKTRRSPSTAPSPTGGTGSAPALFPDHPWRHYLERKCADTQGPRVMRQREPSWPGRRRRSPRRPVGRGTGTIASPGSGTRAHAAGPLPPRASTGRRGVFVFVLEAVSGSNVLGSKFELQIMYGIGGEKDLTEKTSTT